MRHRLERVAAPKESAGFSVLREDHVMVLERRHTADDTRFFAQRCHVKTDSVLSLGHVKHCIRLVNVNHSSKHTKQKIGTDVFKEMGLVVRVEKSALVVEQAKTRDFGVECAPVLQFVGKGMFEQIIISFLHFRCDED